MKVETVISKPEFSPITFHITLESFVELKMFVNIVGYNESIPKLITEGDKTADFKLCQDMLTTLHGAAVKALHQ